ncbi:MAG: tetratricopeptide repeat protein [Candidatus Eiseniibacteriota bacterium]
MSATEPDVLARLDEQWDFGDPAGTEAKFRRLLDEAGGAGADRSALLQVRTQIARALGLQKKYDEAGAVLEAVERELDTADPIVRVRWLLERGRVANTSGRKDDARPLFEEAWRLGRETSADAFAVDAAHMVAIVSPPDEAVVWNERALDLARASTQERARRWRGSLLNNLGWTYHGLGRFERAHALFEEALAFRLEQGDAGPVRIARWCVARALRSLGRVEKALAAQQALLTEHDAAGSSDGFVHEEIAECLLALRRRDEARPHFAKAFELLSQDPWLPQDEPQRLERLRREGAQA